MTISSQLIRLLSEGAALLMAGTLEGWLTAQTLFAVSGIPVREFEKVPSEYAFT
jgi:hypothetical protein